MKQRLNLKEPKYRQTANISNISNRNAQPKTPPDFPTINTTQLCPQATYTKTESTNFLRDMNQPNWGKLKLVPLNPNL